MDGLCMEGRGPVCRGWCLKHERVRGRWGLSWMALLFQRRKKVISWKWGCRRRCWWLRRREKVWNRRLGKREHEWTREAQHNCRQLWGSRSWILKETCQHDCVFFSRDLHLHSWCTWKVENWIFSPLETLKMQQFKCFVNERAASNNYAYLLACSLPPLPPSLSSFLPYKSTCIS